MSATGEENGPPLKLGAAQADFFAALLASNTITMAYLSKLKTGKGTYIDLAMLDMQVFIMGASIVNYVLTGDLPKRLGNAHHLMVPHQNIRTKDVDITIASLTERAWVNLWKVLGKPEILEDPRFLTNDGRAKHRELIISFIEEITVTREADYWVQKLNENNVPAGVINTIDRVVSHKQVEYRKMMRKVQHPDIGEILLPGIPWKLNEIDDEEIIPPPLHGQHTVKVLKEVLNKTEEEILELQKLQIITPKTKT